MRVTILEDEALAAAQLVDLIHRWDPEVRVTAVHESVRDAVDALRAGPEPDLLFADVRLSDGLSFRVFDEVPVRCPVVFATAYDAHVVEALERNAIDYLLKPLQAERVARALDKYVRLREHFQGRLTGLADALSRRADDGPARVIARRGAAFVAVPLERIAWFTTEHKLTLLVDRDGVRLAVDEGLAELEARLPPRRFFRLNRQVLAQVDAVGGFRSAGRGRIEVTLAPAADDEVVVSQEAAAAFRAWIAR